MTGVDKKIRELRREIAALENGEHAAHAEEKAAEYLAGLQRERAGLVQQLEIAFSLGDRRQFLQGSWSEKTGTQLAREIEAAIIVLEAEIARVS